MSRADRTANTERNQAIHQYADATQRSVTGTEPELTAAANRLDLAQSRVENQGAVQLSTKSSHRK